MPTQTILSPGVQINEIDLSLRAVVPNGTNVLVLGFAQQGPIEEVFEIPDIQTFETIYGMPTNAAERYFYYSTRGVLDGGGRPIVSRLPYGSGEGTGSTDRTYSCLAYPAIPVGNSIKAINAEFSGDRTSHYTFSDELSGYVFGAPVAIELTEEQYNSLEQNDIQWVDGGGSTELVSIHSNDWFSAGFTDLGKAAVIVLNKFKSTFDAKSLEGYVLGISDSFDADPSSDFTSVKGIKYSAQGTAIAHPEHDSYSIPASRLNFNLTSTSTDNKASLSRDLETQGSDIELYQASFIDSISIGVYKLRQSLYTPEATTLDFTVPDGYVGSINSYRKVQDRNGGPSRGFFVGDIEDNSTYIQVLVNPFISTTGGDWTNEYGKPNKYVITYHGPSDTESKFVAVTANPTYVNTPLYQTNPYNIEVYNPVLSSVTVNWFDYDNSPAFTPAANYGLGGIPGIDDGTSEVGTLTANIALSGLPALTAQVVAYNDDPANSVLTTTLFGDLSSAYRSLSEATYTGYFEPNPITNPNFDSFTSLLSTTLPPLDAAYSYGVTEVNKAGSDLTSSKVAVGNIPGKIDRVFQTIDDVDALRIDLSVEAGLGTIYAQCNTLNLSSFEDNIKFNIGSTSDSTGFYRTNGELDTDNLQTQYLGGQSATYKAQTVKDNYNGVYTQFETFARSIRKDHMFIADPLRPFVIEGANTKILSNKSNTFVQHVYTPIKNLYDVVSTSYAAVYANWAKLIDLTDGQPKWVPFSGLLAGMMAADDANFAPWYAPAGFTRGKIPSPLLDIAVSPSQRNRDSVYKIGVNPITKFPNDGITVFGQKTQLSTPSAFDRINVRRLFLYLEKITRSTMKYFVFEPNTVFTRTRVVNVLRPQFEIVKNNQGMYDYLIVCDERNNTPEVIDQNQLIVDIYIKPTRAAEFILVNFYATRTDQDFNELI